MYKPIDVDAAVEHIKNIVDSVRCAVCDRADGTRNRYNCGHTSCEDCVVLAADCSRCLTPLQRDSTPPVVDKPFTQRAADAVNLLNVFQNEFHLDVYKRHRISEQLKVEKELFPECIQAPAKYFNKRKSSTNIKLDKENRLSQLPGEEVPSIPNHKMEKQSENVEIWLTKYLRTPFAELNSNNETLRNKLHKTPTVKKQLNPVNKEKAPPIKRANRKRTHSKTTLSMVKNQTLIVDHLTPVKKTKALDKEPRIEKICTRPNMPKYFHTGTNINITDNNESGIVMDDEAVIVIDDSQSIVDKDRNAWLAVQEAERNEQYECASLTNLRSNESSQLKEKADEAKDRMKVPFYLKGNLSDKCIDCIEGNHDVSAIMSMSTGNKLTTNTDSTKDVSITVENKSFITVIKIQQIGQAINKRNCMQSVEVQTERAEKNQDSLTSQLPKDPWIHGRIRAPAVKRLGEYILQDEEVEHVNKEIVMKSQNTIKNVIIEESDSDQEDVEASVSLEVTAEIHRSCQEEDYSILADVDDLDEHRKRARRAPRGVTPSSNNSSEKENCNPNRMKKASSSKKKPMKKLYT